LSSTISQKIY